MAVVFEIDPKLVQAMSPVLERVLIVDPGQASARLLTELLRQVWPGQVWSAPSVATGLALAETSDPQLIFVEYAGAELDGLAFTRRLRRSDFACRRTPVIMVTGQATPQVILGARDAGVHEFLRKPFTFKDLARRIEAVARHPRGWIEGVNYVGPDRRRFNSADYKGARKRRVDAAENPEQARLLQALRIVAAAQGAIDTDRRQALRALHAQAAELRRSGEVMKNMQLFDAANALQDYLKAAIANDGLSATGLQVYTRPLLALLPRDEARARTAA